MAIKKGGAVGKVYGMPVIQEMEGQHKKLLKSGRRRKWEKL